MCLGGAGRGFYEFLVLPSQEHQWCETCFDHSRAPPPLYRPAVVTAHLPWWWDIAIGVPGWAASRTGPSFLTFPAEANNQNHQKRAGELLYFDTGLLYSVVRYCTFLFSFHCYSLYLAYLKPGLSWIDFTCHCLPYQPWPGSRTSKSRSAPRTWRETETQTEFWNISHLLPKLRKTENFPFSNVHIYTPKNKIVKNQSFLSA